MRVKELIEILSKFDEDYFVQIRKPSGNAYREIQNVRKFLKNSGSYNMVIIEYSRKSDSTISKKERP